MAELSLKPIVEQFVQFGYLDQGDLESITNPDNERLVGAIAKFQANDANVEEFAGMAGNDLLADGVIGPATELALQCRCGMPDVQTLEAAPVIGQGGWKGCLAGFEDYHVAFSGVSSSNMTSKMQSNLKPILRIAQKAYREIGLLIIFVDDQKRDILTGRDYADVSLNFNLQWVHGNGWIGLANVGNGREQCSTYYPTFYMDPRYGRNFEGTTFIRQQAALLVHELGHLAGLHHKRATTSRPHNSIMNPGIMDNSMREPTWRGDLSEGTLRRRYGGELVPAPPGSDPDPDPDPDPPSDGEMFRLPKVNESLGEGVITIGGGKFQLVRVFG